MTEATHNMIQARDGKFRRIVGSAGADGRGGGAGKGCFHCRAWLQSYDHRPSHPYPQKEGRRGRGRAEGEEGAKGVYSFVASFNHLTIDQRLPFEKEHRSYPPHMRRGGGGGRG